jgi:hypothetical protein
MALLDTIKKAGAAAYASGNPTAVLIGKVVRINPLEVNVDQRFTLLLRVQGGQQYVVLDKVVRP